MKVYVDTNVLISALSLVTLKSATNMGKDDICQR